MTEKGTFSPKIKCKIELFKNVLNFNSCSSKKKKKKEKGERSEVRFIM